MESDNSKLFVGGISRESSEYILKDHFSKYGTVLSSTVAKDRITQVPRGFGFVSFSESSAADKALQDTHVILGRTVEVKKAIPRTEQKQQLNRYPDQLSNSGFIRNGVNDAADSNNQCRTKKLFVGGLSASLTEEEFKNYFERFGRITDVVVMHDSLTNRPRGFGFVTFDSEESVENVMQKSFHELSNRLVEVKRAVPKEGSNGRYNNHNMKSGVPRESPYAVQYNSNNGPGYGMFPGYAPVPGYNPIGDHFYGMGVYGSGYPNIGYGVAPATPRGPIYAPIMLGARVYPMPYGNASIYPSYMNSGVSPMGTMASGFNGINGTRVDEKWNKVRGDVEDLPENDTQSQLDAVNMGSGGGSSEPDQKSVDGQLKPSPVDVSR